MPLQSLGHLKQYQSLLKVTEQVHLHPPWREGYVADVKHAQHTLLLNMAPQKEANKVYLSLNPLTLPLFFEQNISKVNLVTCIWANVHMAHINEWDHLNP